MVSINPGVALGGAILGITPGAALEKKSVRDIAANFAASKLGEFAIVTNCNLMFSFLHDFMIFLSPSFRAHYYFIVLDPKPRYSSHSHVSKLSTDSISLLNENRLSSSSSNSDHENGKPDVAVRRIAGKKISALFEV